MLPASGNDLADRACDCLLSLLSPRHVTSSSGPVDRSGAGNTAPCARMPCPSRATWPAGVAIHVCLPCRGHGGRRVSAPNLLTASRDGSTDLDLDRSAPRGGGRRPLSACGWEATWSRPIRPLDAGGPSLPRSVHAPAPATARPRHTLSPCQSVTFSFTWAGIASPLRPVPTPQFPWGACTRRHLGPCAAGT